MLSIQQHLITITFYHTHYYIIRQLCGLHNIIYVYTQTNPTNNKNKQRHYSMKIYLHNNHRLQYIVQYHTMSNPIM
jgi:hypothetical protein